MSGTDLFDRAVVVVLANEGETCTDHPDDAGGLTKYGISRRWNPDVDVENLTREEAIEIYRESYWEGEHYDELPPEIAIKTFDLAVNMGKADAVKCLQRGLRASGFRVAVDGVLGPETWGAARRAKRAALLAALRSEAAGEYRLRVVRDATQVSFLDGWLNRAYA